MSEKFNGLSLSARLSYGVLCAENYVVNVYPNRNWKPLFQKLWMFSTDMFWDEWEERIMEVTPEYLFEFQTYEESDFEYLTKEEYNFFVKLFKDTDAEINTILLHIIEMEQAYAYTSFYDNGLYTLPLLSDIESILASKNIPLPNIEKVSFSKITEADGFGTQFDAKKLSQII